MKLRDHREGALSIRPTLLRGPKEDLPKLRRGVLKHVLGFKFVRRRWRNEGWDLLFEVLDAQRDAAEDALRRFVIDPAFRVGVTDRDLDDAIADPGGDAVRAIADELVPSYREALVDAIDGWIVDYHWASCGRYKLTDHRGVFVAGMERHGEITLRTCYRAARPEVWCDRWTNPERVRSGHQQAVSGEYGVPEWHERG